MKSPVPRRADLTMHAKNKNSLLVEPTRAERSMSMDHVCVEALDTSVSSDVFFNQTLFFGSDFLKAYIIFCLTRYQLYYICFYIDAVTINFLGLVRHNHRIERVPI